jgi:hypothetical protein
VPHRSSPARRPSVRQRAAVGRSRSGSLPFGRVSAVGWRSFTAVPLAVILHANRAAVNFVRPVSIFTTTLKPTLRDSESLTHSAPVACGEAPCAHSYEEGPAKGASRLASNSQLPTSCPTELTARSFSGPVVRDFEILPRFTFPRPTLCGSRAKGCGNRRGEPPLPSVVSSSDR